MYKSYSHNPAGTKAPLLYSLYCNEIKIDKCGNLNTCCATARHFAKQQDEETGSNEPIKD